MSTEHAQHLIGQVDGLIVPRVPPGSSITVALSGGVDSVVLLHVLQSLAETYCWRLSAVHVHHGISRHADAWAAFCKDLCGQRGVPLQVEHVDIAPLRSHGLEAAARKLRHAAFSRQHSDFVALAQHADDQAETLLLQLLRGAGVRGASAMPVLGRAGHASDVDHMPVPNLLRPLLQCTRQAIRAYADTFGLCWVEDESNADERYPRNFLRHRILPLLETRFPAYRDTLSRSTQHFSEAGDLLDELASQDASGGLTGTALRVETLRALSRGRAKNLLRYFLDRQGVPMPHAVHLEELLHQLCDARQDASVLFRFGVHEVRRYQDSVHVLPLPPALDHELIVPWRGEAAVDWPPLAKRINFQRVSGAGVSMQKMGNAPLTLRLRRGGETLRLRDNAGRTTLKNLLQQSRIPPWQRARIPLLFCGEELTCVAGLAIDAGYRAGKDEEGMLVSCE